MDLKPIAITSLLLSTILLSCGADESAPPPVNPNGDSELAILMRAMADEAEQIKAQIANGEAVTLSVAHPEILTAEATEPEKAASAPYQAFASSYLETITYLKTSTPENVQRSYDAMVNGCITCHQALCPGPLVRIEKLR